MLKAKVTEFLKKREFVSVATADRNCRPSAAPKFILKIEGNFIYLVDYSISRTWENLKVNPTISLSFMDADTLTGYQVNGSVEIIDKGDYYEKIVDEISEKRINLSTKRIIDGIYRGKKHEGFELTMSERVIVFKVKIEEVVEICPHGELKREKV